LTRAVVTSLAQLEKTESPQKSLDYDYIRHGRPFQKRKAEELRRAAKVDIDRIGGGIDALKLFQVHLRKYKLQNLYFGRYSEIQMLPYKMF